ncbi:MAG: DNA polymerase III subunit gamma/tau [Deltaproteobacteria bacterium]|nr:DNA polymerase III subunit gamma/tau [Deltaproteobacteria bacterium]
MSYLVLARRERPQLFGDVVGQHHVVRTLQNAIRTNRVHHAYLFCGTRGVGKTSTARILAKALNCDLGPAPEPCNECSACREITDGSAVDVIEVDAATHRGVEEAQRFLEGVPYRPSRLRYKFYIIDEVHMMTRHAFNALLKTFEEPPAHVKFVFATTEAQKVPATILSRCQRFDFRELGTEEISGALGKILEREGVGVSARARSWIVREARGSMRDALSLLDQVLAFAADSSVSDEEVREVLGGVEVEIIESAIQSLVGRDPDRMLEVIGEVVARGHDLKSFLASLLEALRAAMVAKAAGSGDRFASAAEVVRLELFEGASLEDVVRWIDQGLRCQVELQRTEEPRLTLETALVRATLLAPTRPLAEAVARLEALEGRLGGAGGAAPAGGGGAPRAASAPAASAPPSATPATRASRLESPAAAPAAKPSRLETVPADPPRGEAAPTKRPRAESEPAVVPAAKPAAAATLPPAPPAASAPRKPAGDPAKELAALVRHFKDKDPRFARFLDLARSLTIDGDRLVAALEPGLAFDELKETESEKRISEAATAVLGRPLALKLTVAAPAPAGTKKAAKADPPADPAQIRAMRSKALEDPVVRQALDLFGGEVVDVKPHTVDDKNDKGGRS